jgi:hypothetical protein
MRFRNDNELRSIFGKIEDPRSDINKLHKLEDIFLIGIISVVCAADTWKTMETYAKAKEEFLRSFLDLPNVIPECNPFRRHV